MQVENKVLEGPKSDFVGFLAACDELHKNVEYLTLNRSLKASATALNQASDLFGKGMSRLEEEFKVLLTNHRSVPLGMGGSCSILLLDNSSSFVFLLFLPQGRG